MGDPQEGEYGLVMPFVVCESQGGPYDDSAFVAGWEAGAIDRTLHALAPMGGSLQRYVHSQLVPQLDLLAMHHGFTLISEPWDEHPDEWTLVTFTPSMPPEGETRGETRDDG